MTIYEALYVQLHGTTAIHNITGDRIDRIIRNEAETNPIADSITYFVVAADRVEDYAGNAGLTAYMVQVSCWSSTYEGVRALAEQVRISLQGFKGVMGGVGGLNCTASGWTDRDFADIQPDGTYVYHVPCETTIWVQE